MSSPTAKTLAHLRQLGYLAAVVERYIAQVQRHRDLFGIGDVLAVHPRDQLILLVQCTSAAHVADRLRRVQSRPETVQLLRGGVAVEVWGWGPRGLKRVAVQPADLAAVTLEAPKARRARKGERQRDLWDVTPAPREEPPE